MSDKARAEAIDAATAPRIPVEKDASNHERRVLTALCYDLVGSTQLLGLLDIEDFEELISAFQLAARLAISTCSGVTRVEVGDGGVALFPDDIDAKDAASLAIRAGLGIVDACRRVAADKGRDDLHVRVGIATSMTLVQRGNADLSTNSVTGPAFAMATRLQAIAEPDWVLVSGETRNLARRSHSFSFCGATAIKGFSAPEPVWRALSHKRAVDRFFAFGRLGGPLIGRATQLELIHQSWRDAVAGHGGIVIIEGEAGIGKSRILHDVRRRVRFQRPKFLQFQCLPGNSRSSLHPLLQNVQRDLAASTDELSVASVSEAFGSQHVYDPDVVNIFSFLLGASGADGALKEADPEIMREKLGWAARRALEAMCASGPVLIAVEDIHWIDGTSRQLLLELAQFVHRCPALLILTTRPGGARWVTVSHLKHILLGPLDREETRLAIDTMLPGGKASAQSDLLELIERVTGGIPLFIEEVCQWAAQNAGVVTEQLTKTESRSHASVFESVLEARLQPLGPAREIAHAAAVAGSRFSQDLLGALLPEFGEDKITDALDALIEAGLVTRARHGGIVACRFRHSLIQETIYNGTLRKRRRTLHRRLFVAANQNRNLAAWMTTASLAEHAERAGLIEEAIGEFVSAGTESSSRSAMTEAKQLLEHALSLCEQVADPGKRDVFRLSAMMALGPVLTATEGSLQARKNYEDGIEIAARRPIAERTKWFPIYWGWWYTGPNFRIMHDRALRVQEMLSGIADPEITLQIKHCIWAIDFNLGRHQESLDAIEAGLALYNDELARTNRGLFGGHDAKVCGLGQKSLSLWLVDLPEASDAALEEMISFADSIGHAASKAHSLDIEAASAFYREDFGHAADISENMREFAAKNEIKPLTELSLLFGGWANARLGDLTGGHALFDRGLATVRQRATPVDLPIYLDMQAAILELEGKLHAALDVVTGAVAEAEETGHAYWLAELYRRRADLIAQAGGDGDLVAGSLRSAIKLAKQQGATALLGRAIR